MSFKSLEEAVITLGNNVIGETVTYTQGGVPADIKGVFDDSYVEIEGVVSLKPTLRIKLSDLPSSPRKGDSVVVSSVSYRVLESRPDGFGGSTLILHKA